MTARSLESGQRAERLRDAHKQRSAHVEPLTPPSDAVCVLANTVHQSQVRLVDNPESTAVIRRVLFARFLPQTPKLYRFIRFCKVMAFEIHPSLINTDKTKNVGL